MVENTRDKWEGLKNGCPWLKIGDYEDNQQLWQCMAITHGDNDCHYKSCAILYWFRHLIKPLDKP